jgi:hypothetical protein
MNNKKFFGKITIVFILSIIILSLGCIDAQDTSKTTPKQNPLYYDEKAIYIMKSSLEVLRDDLNDFPKNISQLSSDSQDYYHEIDKLIVSPSLQPAVDEFKHAMERYNEAVNLYDKTHMECRDIPYGDETSKRLYQNCLELQKSVNDKTVQNIEDATTSLINSIKLIP